MTYSPPKKITVVISFLLLALGIILMVSIYWIPAVWDTLSTITIGTLSPIEFWVIIGLGLVFLSWLLLFIGINYRGI
ncbi:MAG: hypothetical protein GF311_09300 [Candidatus Lokiarchaeota archaeon]|nr:hypothetical protein [Candidatus Lokiarchaeota archaeon]